MLNMLQISGTRRKVLKDYMEAHGLTCLMFLNPGLGNWNQWLSDGMEQGPGAGLTQFPFNRDNLYIVPPEGPVVKKCAVTAHPTDANIFPELCYADVRDILGSGPVGVINPEAMKKVTRDDLYAGDPSLRFVDVTRDLDRLKAVKSPPELDAAKEAAKIMDRAFTTVPMILRDGKLEHDVAVALRERIAEIAVSTEDLNTTIALDLTSAPDGGPSAREPMEYPGRRIGLHDRVNIIVNTYALEGVACVLGRSYVLGPASEEARKYWDLAVEAQHAAAAAAKPGATLSEVRKAVQDTVFAPNGIPEDTTNWCYGLGVYRCEAPRVIDDTRDMPLEAGMVLAIGPAVKPEGMDAYCCMDSFMVTESGAVRLSKTSQELTELGFMI